MRGEPAPHPTAASAGRAEFHQGEDAENDCPVARRTGGVCREGCQLSWGPLPTQWQGTRPVKLGCSADTVAGGQEVRHAE